MFQAKELYRFGHKEDETRIDRFVYQYTDLNTIEQKTRDRKYKYLEQFIADARTIVHNTFLVFGGREDIYVIITNCVNNYKC